MQRKNRKCCVCCPSCGKIVFKGTFTESEHICPKCRAAIGVWMKDGVVIVYDRQDESRKETTAYRLNSYLESLSGTVD